MFSRGIAGAACAALLSVQSVSAISLDLTSTASIKEVAFVLSHGMMNYYSGNKTGNTLGELPGPYYWWEAGAMWGSLIDYWYYTGDTTYNQIVTNALQFQVGSEKDYMPINQTKDEGNDDQGFWGMSVMSAAEANFPNPPSKEPQWLALAQGVFNSQALRWDNDTCGGGLRWQIFTFNNGYNYKNSISNGCFFNIAARLGRYTGNQTYFDWAAKTFDWVQAVGLIDASYNVFDGTDDTENCTTVDHLQWSYNAGVYLYGAAIMWNATQSDATQAALWQTRVESLWNATDIFFTTSPAKVMYEVACEPSGNCDTDQLSFKAHLSRWMAATIKVAPFLTDSILPYLQASASAAAESCTGGTDGVTCGTKWTVGKWDGAYGVGQQMSALQVVQANLIANVAGPLTSSTGGTSQGDVSAGTGGDSSVVNSSPIETKDRAGAGIITAMVLIMILGGAWWMVL